MRSLVALALLAACGGTETVDIDLIYDPNDTCDCAFDDVVFIEGADIIVDVFNSESLLAFGCGNGSTLEQLAADLNTIEFGKFTEKEVAVEVTVFSPPVIGDYVTCEIAGGEPPIEMLGDSPVVDLSQRSSIAITVFCDFPLDGDSCRTN